MRKLFVLLGLAVLVLAVAVGAKTLLTPSRQMLARCRALFRAAVV